MDLDAATDELYGLAPQAFLARRSQLVAAARAAGERDLASQIGGLRKPSVAAWAVNRMARTRPDEVERLTDLAQRLRSAQQSLDGSALKALGRERAALVDALVEAAVESAGEEGITVSAAAARDAAATFVAALASPEATAAVVSGRLTRAVTYAGFGDVDVGSATARALRAVPDPDDRDDGRAGDRATAARPAREAAPLERDDPALTAAQDALRAAMAAATETASRRSVAVAELERAESRVAQLTREMARARSDRDAKADLLANAEVADEAAQERAEATRAAVDTLRGAAGSPKGSNGPGGGPEPV